MPAASRAQQQAAAIALSAKRGQIHPSKLQGASSEMYNSMEDSDLEDFASTKHSGLPQYAEQKLREYIRKTIQEVLDEIELNEDVINENGIIEPLTYGDLNARQDQKYTFFEKINEIIEVINDLQNLK